MSQVPQPPRYYTVPELAQMTKLSSHTVQLLIDAEQLPAVRFGRSVRIPREAFEAWEREQLQG